MKGKPIFYYFLVLFIFISLFLAISTPFLYSQIRDVIFDLNLQKNREQGERIATLASIDLEKGEKPEVVLAKIQKMLENTPQSSEHFACIVEHENKVIAHPKPSNVNKDVTGWTLESKLEKKTYTQSAGEGIPFGGVQTRLDGSQDLTYQFPISSKPWSVAVHTKLSLIDEKAKAIFIRIAWFTIPCVILFMLLMMCLIIHFQRKE